MTFVITMERKIASRKMLHENDPQVWATLFLTICYLCHQRKKPK